VDVLKLSDEGSSNLLVVRNTERNVVTVDMEGEVTFPADLTLDEAKQVIRTLVEVTGIRSTYEPKGVPIKFDFSEGK